MDEIVDQAVTPEVGFKPFFYYLNQQNNFAASSTTFSTSVRTFKNACFSLATPPSCLHNIFADSWSFFWSLALTMVQMNVTYRFITKCIPHKALLNRIFPDNHPESLCIVCSSSTDSIDHFLFDYPP